MRVRSEVKIKSDGKQVPFEYSSIVKNFYFAPAASAPSGGTTVPEREGLRPPPPVRREKEQPNDSIVVPPLPASASEIFEITPWNFHPHPTAEYQIFLEPNVFKICFITVTNPRMQPAQFDCSALPEGKWMRLLGQSNINLPIQVLRRGVSIYAQWLR